MKPFNLAESRIVQRNYCQTYMNRRVKTIALLSLIAVVVVGISYGCNILISRRAAKVHTELANIQKRCAEIRNESDSAKAQLDQRQWQDQLATTSDSWLSVVNAVLVSLPEDVWVTRFETSPKDSTMQIDGRASDYDSLSAFIAVLHRNKAFSDIRLGTVRIVRIGQITALEFTVPMKLKSHAAEAAPVPATQANSLAARRSGA